MAMDRSPAQTALLAASQALDTSRSVPAVLERAGAKALFAADEFFAARISNPHTRRAYARVVRRFLTWCEDEGLELSRVSPGLAGRFIDELPGDSSTKNQALTALRHFFDTLVTRHAAPLNPFQSVRGRKHDTTDGKTPGLSIPQARDLLGSIDTSHIVGLRDRALLGTLAYTGARIGAVARLRRGDLEDQGPQQVLRFREKGGASSGRSPSATTSTAGSGSIWRRPASVRIPRNPPCFARPWISRSSSPRGPCRPTPWTSCSSGGSRMPGCPDLQPPQLPRPGGHRPALPGRAP